MRHSVMLLGPTGCAKSTIWKTLAGTHNIDHETFEPKPKKTCVYETVNPKSVTGDELYGYMTLAKDWKDGVLSIIMRGMAKNFWTRASTSTRLQVGGARRRHRRGVDRVDEHGDGRQQGAHARVERARAALGRDAHGLRDQLAEELHARDRVRAGILFINETDIGWRPMMETWVASREDELERSYLPGSSTSTSTRLKEMVRKGYKECTVLRVINKVATTIYLLEGLLPEVPGRAQDARAPRDDLHLLPHVGVRRADDDRQVGRHAQEVSEDFQDALRAEVPEGGPRASTTSTTPIRLARPLAGEGPGVRPVLHRLAPGARRPFSKLNVDTVDTCRTTQLMDLLASAARCDDDGRHCGHGQDRADLGVPQDARQGRRHLLSVNINDVYFTDSFQLQGEMELSIDKRAGRMFGPPATKKLIYFIDDLNLPYIETYGTQNAIALLASSCTTRHDL